MSTLEIKGSIYDSIAKINDRSLLLHLYELISEITSANFNKTDFWDELSADQKAEIEHALEESRNEKNLVSHHLVMEKYKKWIN